MIQFFWGNLEILGEFPYSKGKNCNFTKPKYLPSNFIERPLCDSCFPKTCHVIKNWIICNYLQ